MSAWNWEILIMLTSRSKRTLQGHRTVCLNRWVQWMGFLVWDNWKKVYFLKIPKVYGLVVNWAQCALNWCRIWGSKDPILGPALPTQRNANMGFLSVFGFIYTIWQWPAGKHSSAHVSYLTFANFYKCYENFCCTHFRGIMWRDQPM